MNLKRSFSGRHETLPDSEFQSPKGVLIVECQHAMIAILLVVVFKANFRNDYASKLSLRH